MRQWVRDSLYRSKKFRFFIVGAYNTAFGYLAFVGLYLTLGSYLHYLIVVVLAHTLAVANAFLGHRHWVFRSRAPWWPEYLRFNLSYLGSLALGMASMVLLVKWLTINIILAQGLTIATTVVLSYLLHHHFTFKHQSDVP